MPNIWVAADMKRADNMERVGAILPAPSHTVRKNGVVRRQDKRLGRERARE